MTFLGNTHFSFCLPPPVAGYRWNLPQPKALQEKLPVKTDKKGWAGLTLKGNEELLTLQSKLMQVINAQYFWTQEWNGVWEWLKKMGRKRGKKKRLYCRKAHCEQSSAPFIPSQNVLGLLALFMCTINSATLSFCRWILIALHTIDFTVTEDISKNFCATINHFYKY